MQEITVKNNNGLRDWTIVVQREEPTIKMPDGKEILL
jgi:hypothetical protein